jgi:hypothetical protein
LSQEKAARMLARRLLAAGNIFLALVTNFIMMESPRRLRQDMHQI